MTSTDSSDTPTSVTMREVKELLRTFEEAGWASLDLTMGDLHIVLGRDGAPSSSSPAAPAPAPPLAEPPAAAPSAPGPVTAAPVAAAGPAPDPTPAASPPISTPPASADAVEVRAPVVGTFWVAPSPGQPPFIEVGQQVTVGQQLGIVEVMKLMSDISSPVDGTVVQILAANASMVEYDEVLVVIEPSHG
jgi:acetyl-CoA carboxylase biotin carboxyl carrier protein